MNSRERILTAARGGKPDCVPVAPYIGNWGAAIAGVPISQYNTNGKNMADAQIKAWEKAKLDVVVAQSDNYYIAEGFGCQIEQPENQTPHITKYALDKLEDVVNLKSINPYKDGRMYVFIEAVSRLKEKLGNDVAIRSSGTGIFSLAGHLLGTENLILEIALAEVDEDIERQKMIMQLLSITSDALILFSKAVVEAGCDFVICGDSSASPDLISPDIYSKYIFKHEKKVFDALAPICKKHDAVSLLHICGNTISILDQMADTGADILEIDHKVDLAKAREIVGSRVCLMGNLDPVTILMDGTPEMVESKASAAISSAGLNGGFILGSGCEVAMRTSLENIIAMRETGHNYKY